ncbi:hypothetical protein RC95_03255 [Pectobacterium brasiliense]|nr:hypothetical protein RC95_03255 [Pectobacterium brasiliense]
MSFEFVILKRGEHSVNLHRYLLEVEEKGKIKKYFYNIDHGIPDMIGKNIYFESRYLDNAPINEMLHVSRVW